MVEADSGNIREERRKGVKIIKNKGLLKLNIK
jgi:hypothetical protein